MAKSLATIEAVLFDFGLVLSGPPNAGAWSQLRRHTGFDEETLQRAYWAARIDYDRGFLTGAAYWAEVGRLGGREPDEATIGALLDADTALWTDPNEPMVDWAKRLQRGGVRVGIMSNLGDALTAGVLERWPWLQGFDSLTWSYRTGSVKPEPASYRHAIEGLGLPAEEILFVDDRADNIAGAEAAGLQAIRYADQTQFEEEMARRGLWALWRM